MKTQITTAEQALHGHIVHGSGFTLMEMLEAVAAIRQNAPHLAVYLTHPEIIVGLAEGRFGPNGLRRRLTEMEAADSGE